MHAQHLFIAGMFGNDQSPTTVFYRFHRFISEDTSVHPKMKTDYMQAVSFLTIELQLILRVEGSNNYHFLKKSFKNKSEKSYLFLKNQV